MTTSGDWTTGEWRLLAQRCTEGHSWYLPRQRCPECAAEVSSFEPIGTGTVFAQTSLHRRVAASIGAAPADGEGSTTSTSSKEAIGIALVDLDEGVRMMARCSPRTPIGSRVTVSIVFDDATQRLVPLCEVVTA